MSPIYVGIKKMIKKIIDTKFFLFLSYKINKNIN